MTPTPSPPPEAAPGRDRATHEVVVREREWTSEGLTFYQAKAQSRSGRIYERTIAYHRYGGGPSRTSVHEEVRVAAEVDAAGRARLDAGADWGSDSR